MEWQIQCPVLIPNAEIQHSKENTTTTRTENQMLEAKALGHWMMQKSLMCHKIK
jgi:hypothetical protein